MIQPAARLACACLLLVWATSSAGANPAKSHRLLTSAYRVYDGSEYGSGVAIGDVDADGDPDIAVLADYGPTFEILLVDAEGRPGARLAHAGPTSPSGIALADINGDQWLDVVSAGPGANQVWVFPGQGDGTFDVHRASATGARPVGVAVGDVNGDGMIDVVTANKDANSVSVLLGRGDGTFEPHLDRSVGVRPVAVALADLDLDGDLDVLVGHTTGELVILRAAGDGTLPAIAYAGNGGGTQLTVGNLDSDGIPDVAATLGGGSVTISLSNGSCGIRSTTGQTPTGFLEGLGCADLNGDGILEVVIADANRGLLVIDGLGGGAFAPARRLESTGGTQLATGDIDRDGRTDVVLTGWFAGGVSVHQGDGHGGFGDFTWLTSGARPEAVAIADLNRDGRADVVSADGDADAVSILLQASDGTFPTRLTLPCGDRPVALRIADVTGDGYLDIVTANFFGNSIGLLRAVGDGSFHTAVVLPTGRGPSCLAVGDLNADGTADLVAGHYYTDSLRVYLSDGQGGLLAPRVLVAAQVCEDGEIDDFDEDGRADLAVVSQIGLFVFSGDGGGGFEAPTILDSWDWPSELEVVDLDRDGHRDIVVAHGSGSPSVTIFDGLGSAGFAPYRFAPGYGFGEVLEVGDFDGDGEVDVVTGAQSGVMLLAGDGAGGLDRAATFGAWCPVASIAAGDLNSDGRLDLVAAGIFDSKLSILMNTGLGAVAVEPLPPTVTFERIAARPNPSRGTLACDVWLLEPQVAVVEVFDVMGRRLRELHRGRLEAGSTTLRWDGTAEDGTPVGNGCYFVGFRTGTTHRTTRVALIR